MSEPKIPKSVNVLSKPSNFCPGCGHSLTLKTLGFVIDELDIAQKSVFTTDIGCSLLAWDYYNVDTIQAHHGRAGSTATGVKRALPDSVVIAYMGDGGGYAIGLHHLIHLAKRNEPVTVILVNNTVFAMTGGQKAPTTLLGEQTETTPAGFFTEKDPIRGPELLKGIVTEGAFLARGTVDNLPELHVLIKKGLENQIKNKQFSFIEVLSYCPINWKTDARGSMDFLDKMKTVYKTGIIQDGS
jgi:2-oxoglutarate/2-oxoacid ferredoxin oxidoreductase subunit beta